MMRKTFAALAAVAVVLSANLSAYSPFRSWKTIETAHFRVHFAEEQTALAQTAARLAERIHGELSPKLDWQPKDATDIVIADDLDFANGWATPFPFNQFHLVVTPPDAGEFLEVGDEDEWLYQLIKHEYAHVLHLDAAAGLPAALQKIFGRQPFLFPSVFQPNWLTEGLATDLETDATRGTGRGAGSDMAMRMRAELIGGLKPLQQVSLANMTEWPRGYAAYLYGVHFYQFLRERYGEATLKSFIVNYRRNIIPFRIHKNARLATGKTMDDLWIEFHQWLTERYDGQLASIRAAGVVEGEAITQGGKLEGDSSVVAAPDGSVYYVRGDVKETAALMRYMPDGRHYLVTQVHSQARFDVHPSAGIVLAQPEFCDSERLYFDLYRIAPDTRKAKRITHCARYRHVAWHPDGRSFFAIRMENGRTRIDRLSLDGKLEQTIWSGTLEERASHLTVSPAGKRLVFVRSRHEGTDLVAIELEAPLATQLTHDRNSETRPRFTPDGKAILFNSDHGGISNLRKLDLETGRISTLSNTLTGAFAPTQALENGPIWYMRYTPEGYDLSRLDSPASQPLPAAAAADPLPIRVDVTEPVPEARAYNPWIGLRPRSWWPIVEADNARTVVGAASSGSDALGIHHYQLAIARDLRNDTWLGSAAYLAWDRVLLGVSRGQTLDGDDDNEVQRVRNIDNAWLGVRLPWMRYDHRWGLSTGLIWEREKDDWRATGVAPMRETRDGVIGVAVDLDTTRFVPDSAGPTAGRRVLAQWETSDLFNRNDYTGDTASIDWREYLNLTRARVLAARLSAAYGDRGIKPYELGGSFNETTLSGSMLPFNRRDIDLRSYDDGTLRGRGYQLANLEWRSPVMIVDRTWTTPPLGLTRLNAAFFAESARVLRDGWGSWYSGVGAELIGNVVVGYLLPLDLRVGAAWGFDEDDGGARAYVSLGYGF